MRKWYTHLKAVDHRDDGLKLWVGPVIEAPTKELAQEYCDMNGMGYLKVTGPYHESGEPKKGKIDWTPNYNLN